MMQWINIIMNSREFLIKSIEYKLTNYDVMLEDKLYRTQWNWSWFFKCERTG